MGFEAIVDSEGLNLLNSIETDASAKESIATAADRNDSTSSSNSTIESANSGASCGDFEERLRVLSLTESTPIPGEISIQTSIPILKHSAMYKPRLRMDSQGALIQKASKNHKITFEEDLLKIHIVESYKEYNKIEDEKEGKEEKCNCWII